MKALDYKRILRYRRLIRKTYLSASSSHKEQGTRWYADANAWCVELARQQNIPVKAVCAIVAALSPLCAWELNLLAAAQYVKDGTFPPMSTTAKNQYKAIAVGDGARIGRTIGGPKVRSFYVNLFRLHGTAVTIDRHVYALCGLKGNKAVPSIVQYREIRAAYQLESTKLKLRPSQLQAITWLHQREGVSAHYVQEEMLFA